MDAGMGVARRGAVFSCMLMGVLSGDMTTSHRAMGRRLVVIGTSGAGKTTLAGQVASILGVPHVELDAYRHGPNWAETPDDLFRERLRAALRGDGWVADGNYSVARDVVWPRATTLVWLDYPMHLGMWRLFWRTMRRGVLREELWNGNKENLWWHLVPSRSLFVWAWQTHWKRRRTVPALIAQPEHAHLDVVRLRSSKATREWLRTLQARSADGG